MAAAEKAEELETGPEDHRAASRYGVDEEAHLLLVKQNRIVPCRILDLSLGGCRVQNLQRLPVESMMCVEVNFKVKGLPFRFCGLVQWTDCQHLAGIRFAGVPKRRRDELVETLSEIKVATDARAAERVPEKPAIAKSPAENCGTKEQADAPKAAASGPAEPAVQKVPAPAPLPVRLPAQAETVQAAPPASAKSSKRERRESSREAVETSAVIDLIKIASRLPGRILDLSLSGCRIRTDDPFPVGIYTRIEVEFCLDGLPFRLGGVIQGIHDRHTVGIRFLDMSSRKREQIEQLMEEIREKKELEKGIGNRE
jgi:hypothetical protein